MHRDLRDWLSAVEKIGELKTIPREVDWDQEMAAITFMLDKALVEKASSSEEILGAGLLCLVVTSSVLGYLWFLIQYPNPGKGDTIKATYMLQIFPLCAILNGLFIERLKKVSYALFALIAALMAAVAAHGLPAMFTRYVS